MIYSPFNLEKINNQFVREIASLLENFNFAYCLIKNEKLDICYTHDEGKYHFEVKKDRVTTLANVLNNDIMSINVFKHKIEIELYTRNLKEDCEKSFSQFDYIDPFEFYGSIVLNKKLIFNFKNIDELNNFLNILLNLI